MPSQLNEQKIKSIRTDYEKHKSLRKVCKIHSCSPNTVRKYVQDTFRINTQQQPKKLLSADQRLVGFYVGMWMGDGTQHVNKNTGHYAIKICLNKRNPKLNMFIKERIGELFGITPKIHNERKSNRAEIKFYSKFVFGFINDYAKFVPFSKTHTVSLKTLSHKLEFLEGCLLGLVLTDGYLKKRLIFNVVSEDLANVFLRILIRFGYSPSIQTTNRQKYGWKDLVSVRLRRKESLEIENLLDRILIALNSSHTFRELKYE